VLKVKLYVGDNLNVSQDFEKYVQSAFVSMKSHIDLEVTYVSIEDCSLLELDIDSLNVFIIDADSLKDDDFYNKLLVNNVVVVLFVNNKVSYGQESLYIINEKIINKLFSINVNCVISGDVKIEFLLPKINRVIFAKIKN